MKVTIAEFIRREYAEGSRPTARTIRNRLKRGQIPYRWIQEGGTIYIDLSRPTSQNPLVRSVLDATPETFSAN